METSYSLLNNNNDLVTTGCHLLVLSFITSLRSNLCTVLTTQNAAENNFVLSHTLKITLYYLTRTKSLCIISDAQNNFVLSHTHKITLYCLTRTKSLCITSHAQNHFVLSHTHKITLYYLTRTKSRIISHSQNHVVLSHTHKTRLHSSPMYI